MSFPAGARHRIAARSVFGGLATVADLPSINLPPNFLPGSRSATTASADATEIFISHRRAIRRRSLRRAMLESASVVADRRASCGGVWQIYVACVPGLASFLAERFPTSPPVSTTAPVLGRNGNTWISLKPAGRPIVQALLLRFSSRPYMDRAAALIRADVLSARDPVADEMAGRRHARAVGAASMPLNWHYDLICRLSERLLGLHIRFACNCCSVRRVVRTVRAGRPGACRGFLPRRSRCGFRSPICWRRFTSPVTWYLPQLSHLL